MVTALGLGLVAAGLVLATAGVTDRPVLDVVMGRVGSGDGKSTPYPDGIPKGKATSGPFR